MLVPRECKQKGNYKRKGKRRYGAACQTPHVGLQRAATAHDHLSRSSSRSSLLVRKELPPDPRLFDSTLNQPSVGFGRLSRLGVSERMPCSRSDSRSRGTGWLVPDPDASVSSSLSSWYGSYLGLEGEPRAMDRTTSPLQMGHVRRLVVNHGVLQVLLASGRKATRSDEVILTCTQRGTHGHRADS